MSGDTTTEYEQQQVNDTSLLHEMQGASPWTLNGNLVQAVLVCAVGMLAGGGVEVRAGGPNTQNVYIIFLKKFAAVAAPFVSLLTLVGHQATPAVMNEHPYASSLWWTLLVRLLVLFGVLGNAVSQRIACEDMYYGLLRKRNVRDLDEVAPYALKN